MVEVEGYVKVESETEEFGTVATTIGMGKEEDNFQTEVPEWIPADAYYLEEEENFIENPLDYFIYFPGPSPVPFFW